MPWVLMRVRSCLFRFFYLLSYRCFDWRSILPCFLFSGWIFRENWKNWCFGDDLPVCCYDWCWHLLLGNRRCSICWSHRFPRSLILLYSDCWLIAEGRPCLPSHSASNCPKIIAATKCLPFRRRLNGWLRSFPTPVPGWGWVAWTTAFPSVLARPLPKWNRWFCINSVPVRCPTTRQTVAFFTLWPRCPRRFAGIWWDWVFLRGRCWTPEWPVADQEGRGRREGSSFFALCGNRWRILWNAFFGETQSRVIGWNSLKFEI